MAGAIASAIGFALFNIGAPLGVVNFFAVSALGTALVGGALSIGLSLASAALQRGRSQLPSPSDGQTEVRQALAPRVRSYGRVRISGTLWFLDAIDDVLYMGLAMNHGRIAEYENFFIDQNMVAVDGTSKVITPPYDDENVYILSRLGATPETAYTELSTGFALANMRGDGVATLLATIQNPTAATEFQEQYPNGRPTIRTTCKASVVWDPREDISLGGTQDRSDSTTHEWSENPVVCLLNYMISPDGYGIDYINDVEPNLDQWIAAMDACDELVPLLAGGNAPRYRISLTYRLTDDPAEVLAKFLSTFDGRVWIKRDGTVGVLAGVFSEPTVRISAKHVVGFDEVGSSQDPLHAVVGVRAEFVSPDHDYREHEAEPWPTGESVTDLDTERVDALDLLGVPSLSQARRLMKRHYVRATAQWQGTVYTDAYGLKAIDQRYVDIELDELGIDTSFEVIGFKFDPSGPTCELQVVSVDRTIDDWDPTEEGAEEGGALTIIDSGTVVGTSLDPAVDCGAVAGQTLVVFGGSAVGVDATVTNWNTVATAGPTSSWSVGAWYKDIDGSEGATVFNTTSGVLGWVLCSGLRNAAVSQPTQGAAQVATTEVQGDFGQATPAPMPAAPLVLFTVGISSLNVDCNGYVNTIRLFDLPPFSESLVPDESAHLQNAAGSMEVLAYVYRSDEVPPPDVEGYHTTDHGVNGLLMFALTPG